MHSLIAGLRNGLIVSCQALENEPLYGSGTMALMASAAEEGGAVAIRANTPQDIRAIKRKTSLPVIGLYKVRYPGSEAFITPTIREVREIREAGADLIAIDATRQIRPDGESLEAFVAEIRLRFPDVVLVADVSTFEEGAAAMEWGAEAVSTTLSGYTSYSPRQEHPDVELVSRLAALRHAPVLAEGRIWSPEQCQICLDAGAHAVVVGTAITRPQEITRRFVKSIRAGCGK
ncbi:N-acetylmannosamine-6-phosphate 2-epimerase [Cohnella zeiphila]|uniref:N-acetylmannosamine-6-phosphate 2-epimerase n=1 Tax=Cohnella zeiphila TaxID=2761120 RepID=UPI001EE23301|nr:N-acetylmannosamine-6-phosphate 2-epimerase [Cohnella zeiphila]